MNKYTFFILSFLLVLYNYIPKFIPSDAVYFVIYIITIGFILNEKVAHKENKKEVPGFILACILLLFVFFQTATIYFSGDMVLDLRHQLSSIKWYLFDPLAFYFCITFFIRNQRTAKFTTIWLVLIFSALNALSLCLLLVGYDNIIVPEANILVSDVEINRFRGIIPNANQNAYLQAFLFPYLYYYFRTESNVFVKITALFFILTCLISILMSGSRGALLSVCLLSVGLVFVLKEFKMGLLFSITVGIAIAFLLSSKNFFFLNNTLERFQILLSGDFEKASAGRFKVWESILDLLKNGGYKLILGRGIGSVNYLMTQGGKVMGGSHNIYLKNLIEYGVVGCGLWISFMVSVLKTIFSYHLEVKYQLFRKIIILSVMVVLWASLFSDLAYIIKYFSMFIGASVSLLYYNQNSTSKMILK